MSQAPRIFPPARAGALHGITVLDMSRVVSGPFCTMLLADMGARVIKIERPHKGDDTRSWGPPFQHGESAYFLSINRNKESVAIDFKSAAGKRVLDELLGCCDVFVENFRPGKLAKLGLDYPTVSARNPRLVYCSVSGFGQTGRRSQEAGYDAVAQAEGGFMSVTGTADGPPIRPGIPIADLVSGMFAAYGISLALLARERTGTGQSIDISMFDSIIALLSYQAGGYFATGDVPRRTGNRHAIVAPYETFAASDGEFVLAVGNDEQWRRFCRVAGIEHLATHEKFATNDGRLQRYDELRPLLADCLRLQTRGFWVDALTGAGVPCGLVRTLDQVFDDPQVGDRDMVVDIEHAIAGPLRLLGLPVKMSGTPGAIRSAPPMLGEHTAAVLRELAYTATEIDRLTDDRVVQCLAVPEAAADRA